MGAAFRRAFFFCSVMKLWYLPFSEQQLFQKCALG
jgi:hypothetical protein